VATWQQCQLVGDGANVKPELHDAWRALLDISAQCRSALGRAALPPHDGFDAALPSGRLRVEPSGAWSHAPPPPPELADLLALYLPYCAAPSHGFVAGHLGQSLDGRIATTAGVSRWVTGAADVEHNHRMRALADAVLVGAATVRCDDPLLTVRSCPGRHPVRVILDTNRKLENGYQVFKDGAAPTLVVAAADLVAQGERHCGAELVAVPRNGEGLAPAAICAALAERGLRRIFVEGGGVTVSRFLAAGVLDRLQITVSPLIIGSGRASITLPPIDDLQHGLRPRIRRFALGEDLMYECILTDRLA
jgi:riboflavin-specific deaminase-like protein